LKEHTSLISEQHRHNEAGEAHEHEEQYTNDAIKQAITQGIEPSGKGMSVMMPRWKMTEKEQDEIIAYLKEL
jgi:hypothetical protein